MAKIIDLNAQISFVDSYGETINCGNRYKVSINRDGHGKFYLVIVDFDSGIEYHDKVSFAERTDAVAKMDEIKSSGTDLAKWNIYDFEEDDEDEFED